MKETNGDLIKMGINGEFDVIVHGCNCLNAMGSGIALQVKDNLNEAWLVDQSTKRGDKSKLGDYTKAVIGDLTVINAYTQFSWMATDHRTITEEKPRGVVADYNAIRTVFRKINADFPNKNIGIPLIGAGLAGGDWNIIRSIIDEETPDTNITLVKYVK